MKHSTVRSTHRLLAVLATGLTLAACASPSPASPAPSAEAHAASAAATTEAVAAAQAGPEGSSPAVVTTLNDATAVVLAYEKSHGEWKYPSSLAQLTALGFHPQPGVVVTRADVLSLLGGKSLCIQVRTSTTGKPVAHVHLLGTEASIEHPGCLDAHTD